MLEIVAQVLLEVAFATTGHVVMWVLTIGRWKLFNGRDDAAMIAGILFWVAIGACVWFLFFR